MSASHPLDLAIGAVIRQRRQEIKMSLAELGQRSGTSGQQMQKHELGQNRISFSRLVMVAQALGCRVSDLIGDIDVDGRLNPERVEALDFLRQPGAALLLRGYAGLPEDHQRAVLELVKTLAFNGEGAKPVVVSVFPGRHA